MRGGVKKRHHDRLPPSPEALQRRWNRLLGLGDVLLEEYAWVHSFAYGPSTGGFGERVAQTRGSPTERAALDGSRSDARHALRRVARRLVSISVDLDSLTTVLEASLGKVEAPEPGDHAALSGHEREAAYAAQARREARGEGWGDG
jgi:hypothetical protein